MKKTTLPPRAELNLHTAASLYDSVISPEEVIGTASSGEYSAVAVTDLNSAQFFPNIYYAAKEKGIAHKIIYGSEVKCLCGDREILLTLLVKNQPGCKNLYRIISEEEPQLDFVNAHRDGLLIGFTSDNPADIAVPGICGYIELRPASDEQGIRQKLLTAEKLNIPAVAVSGARYLEKTDAVCRDVLTADTEREGDDTEHELYLRSSKEMLEQLAFLGEDKAYELVIENPNKIAGQIEQIVPVREGRHQFHLPNADKELQELTYKFARKKYGEVLPETVQARLDKELSLILSHDYASCYLLFHKIADHIKKEIPHAYIRGAGNTGAALTAHLLGISDVNPLPAHYICPHCKYFTFAVNRVVESSFDAPDIRCPKCKNIISSDGQDIPWEMIMGIDGESEPDIDIKVTPEGRKKAVELILSLFGNHRVVHIGTPHICHNVGTVKRLIQRFCEKHGVEIPPVEQLRIVEKIHVEETAVGYFRQMYIIPEGEEIYDFFPVRTEGGGSGEVNFTAQFDKRYTDGVLYRVDLSVLRMTDHLKLMEEYTGINYKDVPLNEPEVYGLFGGEAMPGATCDDPDGTIPATLGLIDHYWDIDEFRSVKPDCFSQFRRTLAMRTIPFDLRIYCKRLLKTGWVRITFLILFNEDVYRQLENSRIDSEEAFAIMRRASRGELEQDKETREKLRDHYVGEWYHECSPIASFMRSKVAATENAMYTLRLAWYKLYHPAAFYAATLNLELSKFDMTVLAQDRDKALKELDALRLVHAAYSIDYSVQLCRECLMRGIRFLPPDPEKSDKSLLTPENGDIRLPLEKWEKAKPAIIHRPR